MHGAAIEFTVREAMLFLGVDEKAIGQLIDAGELDAYWRDTGEGAERRIRFWSSPYMLALPRLAREVQAANAVLSEQVASARAELDGERRMRRGEWEAWRERERDAAVERRTGQDAIIERDRHILLCHDRLLGLVGLSGAEGTPGGAQARPSASGRAGARRV